MGGNLWQVNSVLWKIAFLQLTYTHHFSPGRPRVRKRRGRRSSGAGDGENGGTAGDGGFTGGGGNAHPGARRSEGGGGTLWETVGKHKKTMVYDFHNYGLWMIHILITI